MHLFLKIILSTLLFQGLLYLLFTFYIQSTAEYNHIEWLETIFLLLWVISLLMVIAFSIRGIQMNVAGL